MTRRLVAGGLALALAMAGPATGQTGLETGSAAFDRGDFAAAAGLWRDEAAAGSAEAKLGLGLIQDLGLGVPRDPAKALRWYLEAAAAGLETAQFNVGVMLDAGAGVPRDVMAAAVWYGRAAANGHGRAQYNLGMLYAAGEGVPQNLDLARYWFGRATAALPAAEDRLAELEPPEAYQRVFGVPNALAGAVVAAGGARRAELVWSAPAAPPDARFLVEIAELAPEDGSSAAIVLSALTEASARVVRLPARPAAYAWRVSRVDRAEARYAAGPWLRLTAPATGVPAPLPSGRVSFRPTSGDRRAARLARQLAEDLAGADMWTQIAAVDDAATESGVRYAYRADAELARIIAEFLPGLRAEDAILAPALDAAPGEIVVRVVAGTAASSP